VDEIINIEDFLASIVENLNTVLCAKDIESDPESQPLCKTLSYLKYKGITCNIDDGGWKVLEKIPSSVENLKVSFSGEIKSILNIVEIKFDITEFSSLLYYRYILSKYTKKLMNIPSLKYRVIEQVKVNLVTSRTYLHVEKNLDTYIQTLEEIYDYLISHYSKELKIDIQDYTYYYEYLYWKELEHQGILVLLRKL
jgi:hypothetical protein